MDKIRVAKELLRVAKELTALGKVERDVMNLSSGTIGNLIGESEYDRIEMVQNEFFKFTQNAVKDFKTWVEAWNDFIGTPQFRLMRTKKKKTASRAEVYPESRNFSKTVDMLRNKFPFHKTLDFLNKTYENHVAHNYDDETPDIVLNAFRKAYVPWKRYVYNLKNEERREIAKDTGLREALSVTMNADKLFQILISGNMRDWQSGFVTLLARLQRAHEILYVIKR